MTRRWQAYLLGVLLAGATTPFGPSTAQQAIDRMNATSMRGVPTLPAPAPQRDMLWVPDRYVPVPGAPQGVFVPGHWETILPEGGRLAPPPPLPVFPQTP